MAIEEHRARKEIPAPTIMWFRACRIVTAIFFTIGFISGGIISGVIVYVQLRDLQEYYDTLARNAIKFQPPMVKPIQPTAKLATPTVPLFSSTVSMPSSTSTANTYFTTMMTASNVSTIPTKKTTKSKSKAPSLSVKPTTLPPMPLSTMKTTTARKLTTSISTKTSTMKKTTTQKPSTSISAIKPRTLVVTKGPNTPNSTKQPLTTDMTTQESTSASTTEEPTTSISAITYMESTIIDQYVCDYMYNNTISETSCYKMMVKNKFNTQQQECQKFGMHMVVIETWEEWLYVTTKILSEDYYDLWVSAENKPTDAKKTYFWEYPNATRFQIDYGENKAWAHKQPRQNKKCVQTKKKRNGNIHELYPRPCFTTLKTLCEVTIK